MPPLTVCFVAFGMVCFRLYWFLFMLCKYTNEITFNFNNGFRNKK